MNLSDYQDAEGFTGHYDDHGDLEFGDGAQRLGFEYVASWPKGRSKFLNCFLRLFYGPEPVRHPDHTKWYGRPGTMSWDNYFPLFCGLLLCGPDCYSEMKFQFKELQKRWFFLWNTKKIGQQTDEQKIPDWAGPLPLIGKPKTWAIFFRGVFIYGKWYSVIPSLLLIYLFDIITIIDSTWLVIRSYIQKQETSDDLNHLVFLRTAQIVLSSPFLWVAIFVYKRGRALAENHRGEVIYADSGPQSALNQYFEGERNPPLNELWRLPIKEL